MIKHAVGAGLPWLVLTAVASAQTPAGGEFRVNTSTAGFQGAARAAMEPDGDFVVVWQADVQPGIFGQRFAASGAPRGIEFRINTYAGAGLPHVAVGGRGDAVVVWQGVRDGAGSSIQGQRFDAAGSAIGVEFMVNTLTTGNQYRPHVGRASDGRFVVSWRCDVVDGSTAGIAARRFDASGNAAGAEFAANTYTNGFQGTPDLAVAANGDFVAVWEDANNHDGSAFGIFGQLHDAAGNQVGSELQANTFTAGNQRIPSVAVSPAGGFVVAWRSSFVDGSDYGVAAKRFDASGNALGNEFVVNTYTTGRQYGFFGQVAHDARGNFVVTWTGAGAGGAYDTFGQRFSASGVRRGAEFRVNTYTTGSQRRSTVTSDAVGNFVVTWESDGQDGSGFGTFAQRFGGLLPHALAVVDGGNDILEVPDNFALHTTWRNVSGAPRTFQGQGSEFTGPAGLVYTLGSSTADYGTVADGATSTCVTPCLSGALLGQRPQGHVDASVRERIVPDTLGQDQRWILHVGGSFTDVPSASPFYRFVETLLHRQVTAGCTATTYCPVSGTTREQMAVFVLVGKEGAGYAPPACAATPVFADVPASSPFCPWIEELSRRGVVSGCGGGNYCPTHEVSREQMAVFVLRTLDPALNPPACGAPMFADVPATSVFCRWIEELARRGVVTGCGGGNYCPTGNVTREQMAVFVAETFDLALYGP